MARTMESVVEEVWKQIRESKSTEDEKLKPVRTFMEGHMDIVQHKPFRDMLLNHANVLMSTIRRNDMTIGVLRGLGAEDAVDMASKETAAQLCSILTAVFNLGMYVREKMDEPTDAHHVQ